MRSEHRAAHLSRSVYLVFVKQLDALRSHVVGDAVVRNGVIALHHAVQDVLVKVANNALYIDFRKERIDL